MERMIVALTHHRVWQRSWLGPGQEIQALTRATRPGLQEIIRISNSRGKPGWLGWKKKRVV